MSTKHRSTQKRTDLTDTELDALEARAGEAIDGRDLIGIDGDGAIHFWSVRRDIAVFDSPSDTDPQIIDGDQLPDPHLRSWAERVYEMRGPWRDLRLDYTTSAVLETDR